MRKPNFNFERQERDKAKAAKKAAKAEAKVAKKDEETSRDHATTPTLQQNTASAFTTTSSETKF